MKFVDLALEFEFSCAVERGLSSNTVEAYRADLRQYLRHLESDALAADALNVETIKSFLGDMKNRQGLSANTLRRRIACLQGVAGFASESYGIPNPFEGWKPRIKRARRLPRTIPRSEIVRLVSQKSAPFGDETVFAVLVLGATGLRVSEFCAITAGNVSEDGSTIRVLGKGSRDRIVYVTHPSLAKEMGRRRCARMTAAGALAELFVNSQGGVLRPQTLRRRLHRLAERAGLEQRVTPHMLRHTAATLLLEHGADIRFVQRLLGHASIATTEIYTHVTDEALRTVLARADTVGSLLEESSGTMIARAGFDPN